MNFDEASFSLKTVQWVVMAVLGVYTWFTNRQAASAQEMMVLRTRIIALEEHVRHLPDHSAVTDLLGDMKAMRSELTGVKDALAPLSRSLDRINDYLLRDKK
ncbi:MULTISPECIES: DUF2730 domain-containing protein [Pseudomonas]|jgi:hypothetical protein|uniref:DUF2730 domain-containing protein n=1 Tax=Pseudomonas antarctica TaxID=219572 RepID=A0A1H0BWL6_9PSED|nr:DUF2730 domain-containing protein [Pseudomonas antarctica]KAF2406688.1 hypothetical protein PSAN_48650 [Pseudomonas antarctica]SDN50052.1 hypothetical protein SAMN04490179_4525 [Pseudomonas antarctica]